jgi:hypothetical protein
MQVDRLKRRAFITLLGGAAAAWPLAARAQQRERMRRIGILVNNVETDPEAQGQVAVFRQALEQLGWLEGRNIHIEVRFSANNYAVAPAWPAEPVGVAQPATRRRRAGTPLVLVASALLRLDAGGASLIDPMKRSITVGTKAIVDAHHEAIDVLPDVDRERCHAVGGRRERHARRAEVKVVVFGESGPVSREGPLDAATGCPSRLGRIRVCKSAASDGSEGVIVAYPRAATFGINQHRGSRGDADASRYRSQPRDLGIDGEQARGVGVAPFNAGTIEHALETKHPHSGLIVAADLAATNDAAGGMRAEIGPGHAGHRTGDIV